MAALTESHSKEEQNMQTQRYEMNGGAKTKAQTEAEIVASLEQWADAINGTYKETDTGFQVKDKNGKVVRTLTIVV